MTAYDWGWIAGAVVGIGIGLAALRWVRSSRRAESADPQCANFDPAGHRCILLIGHSGEHQVLPLYRRPAAE